MIAVKFYEGLEAVLYIAFNSGAKRVNAKEISANQGKLPRHLEPIMQLLVRQNILKATKGPKGGYTLAKEKRKIPLGDLYRIFLQHPIKEPQSQISKSIISPLSKELESVIINHFDQFTIEDLCSRLNDSSKNSPSTRDFNI